MTILFIVGFILAFGYSWMIVRISNPYFMLLATMGYLIFFVPYGFTVEGHERSFGSTDGEMGKLLGIIIAVLASAVASIALSEIRQRYLTNKASRR
ncbi:MAG: hypothetical protein IBX64_13045 [Actinobacteria bacterium]|nr:hypothetical protein [Actinomycetota bacterium]